MESTAMAHGLSAPQKLPKPKEKGYIAPVKREKKARRSVMIADAMADRVITIGGFFVILAVFGILVFLILETLPLFRSGTVTDQHEYNLDIPTRDILTTAMDEYKTMVFILSKDGTSHLFHAKTGVRLDAPAIDFQGKQVTTFAATLDRNKMALGFSDGTIRFAKVQFPSQILTGDQLPQGLDKLDARDRTDGRAVYSRIPGHQFRKIIFDLQLGDELKVSQSNKALIALGYRSGGEAERQSDAFVAIDTESVATLTLVTSKINLLTGKRRTKVKRVQLPPLPADVPIHSVLLTEKADQVIIADRTGDIYRYNTSNFNAPVLAEITHVLPSGTQLNVFDFLLGGQTIVVGGSDGSLNIYFLMKHKEAGTSDGQALQLTRRFETKTSPPVKFDQSIRGKSFAVADRAGGVQVLHGTSQKTLVKFSGESGSKEYMDILLSKRLDGLMALQADGRMRFWEFSVPHPETTFRTLFRKVWYEGYEKPSYTWQSSAATDDFESKFSLIPLIFGTIKAAFYSLLFAIPIAILGAIYTSEFLHYRIRAFVKPTMEMMASLPSVVLGFVAALVMAPVVETWIAAILLAFVAVPMALMLAAYLWQLVPLPIAIRLQGVPKFSLIALVVIAALFLSHKMGIWFEKLLFEGDFKAWVNGNFGGPEPFLFLVGLPISFIIASVLISRVFGRRISLYMVRLKRYQAAILDVIRWLLIIAGAMGCSYGVARLLGWFGVDLRGSFVDTYVQRNTLIVGFAMGFAVIPIIYTIAEDALNAVPEHLRAASLGCGATPWQTAIYVVLPTAISGVFSAIMIGMGRAVGETMIVVMSAGNTPILDWNIFNGLRALSATIAVELPEAVKDGTLYRILFLSGLVLFGMTFLINTVAEVVRLRFRKRATQL